MWLETLFLLLLQQQFKYRLRTASISFVNVLKVNLTLNSRDRKYDKKWRIKYTNKIKFTFKYIYPYQSASHIKYIEPLPIVVITKGFHSKRKYKCFAPTNMK